jgi:hypothetical protein
MLELMLLKNFKTCTNKQNQQFNKITINLHHHKTSSRSQSDLKPAVAIYAMILLSSDRN